MPVEDIRCPSCRAPQRDLKPGVPHRCVFCKHEFTYVDPKPARHAPTPHPPISVTAPFPPGTKSTSPAGVIVAIATVFVVIGAMTSLVLFRASAPAPRPDGPTSVTPLHVQATPPAVVPIPPVQVAPAAEPTAEIASVSEGRTSIGGRFFLAEYVNSGTVPITSPSVIASGFDANGARLVEQAGYAERASLAPGERTIVLALVAEPPANAVRYEVTARQPQTGGYSPQEIPVEVVESSERASYGAMHDLVGTVRNTSATPLRFVRVVAVGRDADGKAVSFSNGIPSSTELAAGASSGFSLSVGTFEISRPARWELVSFGQPQ